ncbi:hypothetical protein [Microbacterium sp. SLBN-111]|uniref:hypothetical protein n=1 Tax=Microbacterium sp. SLBN-111 TaxID=3377733 RepID=UPI003C78A033
MSLWEPSPRPRDADVFARHHSRRRRRRTAVLVAAAVVGVLVLAGVVVATGADRAVFSAFTAQQRARSVSPALEAVADRAFLTDDARALLHDVGALEANGTVLRQACAVPGKAPDDIAAGCYSQFGIRVYVPADPRLADESVTILAHELLHAAFDRFSIEERVRVSALLRAEMDRLAPDDPVRARIEWSVAGREENRTTEMFAHLGSSVMPEGGFAPELEQVYARFFTDRAALVAVEARVRHDVEALVAEYAVAEQDLATAEAQTAQERAQLDVDRISFEASRAAYQADADRYNAMDPVVRSQQRGFWQDVGGDSFTGSLQEVLAARYTWLEERRQDIEARTASVAAREADDAASRTALEAQYADVVAVTRAMDPASTL